jgi:hypothetical protein
MNVLLFAPGLLLLLQSQASLLDTRSLLEHMCHFTTVSRSAVSFHLSRILCERLLSWMEFIFYEWTVNWKVRDIV